jgi:D-sedoheptulose 7-phosphate isomerase
MLYRMNHAEIFFAAAAQICHDISFASIEALASELDQLRDRKGLFLIGVGCSAANCSHAVDDFRTLCGIETYSPVDNVSELTARTNDEGWVTVFAAWLDTSQLGDKDAILVYSVGGGRQRCSESWGGTADIPPSMAMWSS